MPYNEVLKEIRKRLPKRRVEGEVVKIDDVKDLPDNYIIAGRYAIRKDVFEKLKAEIEKLEPKTVDEIKAILAKYKVGESVLSALGYRIVWKGLNEVELRKVF